jgi:hypothetical protein
MTAVARGWKPSYSPGLTAQGDGAAGKSDDNDPAAPMNFADECFATHSP